MHSVHFVLFGILDALGLAITGSTWLTWVMWLYRAFWMLGVRLGCVSLPRHHLIQASHCDNLSNRKETQTHLYSVLAFAGPSSRPGSVTSLLELRAVVLTGPREPVTGRERKEELRWQTHLFCRFTDTFSSLFVL